MFDIDTITGAADVESAVALLGADPDAVVIAGGSDVLIQIREGRLAGRRLVCIRDIAALQGVTLEEDGTIVIRPLCTFAQVNENDIIQTHLPVLGYAAGQAGGPQLRHIGTIGGNVCNGATSADTAPALLTLNARLEITGPNGRRTAALEGFYAGPGRVKLEHGELLTAICIDRQQYENFHGCYIKFSQRNAMDIATLGCAAHIRLSADKTRVDELRLAFGVAAPTPIRCRAAEENARGAAVNAGLLEAAAAGALAEVSPRTSWRASKEFRQQLVYELTRRVIGESIAKAGGRIA